MLYLCPHLLSLFSPLFFMLVDTHCHLDFDRYDEDRDAVIERAFEVGVERIIIPAVDLELIPNILKLTERYAGVFAAVGIHPNSTAALPDGWLYEIENFAEHDNVVAIGEIGLDYYWDKSPKAVQQAALRDQLELAFDLALPVIIHNRESNGDVIELLSKSSLADVEKPGVLHSFLADKETAAAALELGYFLGFTGPVTYKKNEWLRTIVKQTPINKMLVETDGPFLAPQTKRGKRNEPAYVKAIADFIAELRDIEPTVLANLTTENAACLFGRDVIYGK